MTTEPLRPLEAAFLEAEAVEHARRSLAAARCRAMETALRATGFSPGTLYWSVAVLLAKLAAGWEPVERELGRLADDREIDTRAKDRRRVVRRALAELERWGLIAYTTRTGAARRRTRPESVVVVTIDPRRLAAIAAGEPDQAVDEMRTTAGQRPDNCRTTAGQLPDNGRTTAGQRPDKSANATYMVPNPKPTNPNPAPSGRDAAAAVLLRLGIGSAGRLVDQAIARGCSPRHLVALARWWERSQAADATHWRRPASVLVVRLSEASPNVPAWLGWPDGLARRRRVARAVSRGPTLKELRAKAQAEAAAGPSAAELYRLGVGA